MIREATIDDAARIAEIDVFSSRYAYKRILSEECFYEKNHYCQDGKEKIFKRWNKREIRYIKIFLCK